MHKPWFLGTIKKAPLGQRGSGSTVPAGLALLPLRPGVDEAAVDGRGVLGGDALGISGMLENLSSEVVY
jgi:hypothetical protein